MTTIVTVRYVANGFILTSQEPPADNPAEMYVATLPEVIFWIDAIFASPVP